MIRMVCVIEHREKSGDGNCRDGGSEKVHFRSVQCVLNKLYKP